MHPNKVQAIRAVHVGLGDCLVHVVEYARTLLVQVIAAHYRLVLLRGAHVYIVHYYVVHHVRLQLDRLEQVGHLVYVEAVGGVGHLDHPGLTDAHQPHHLVLAGCSIQVEQHAVQGSEVATVHTNISVQICRTLPPT